MAEEENNKEKDSANELIEKIKQKLMKIAIIIGFWLGLIIVIVGVIVGIFVALISLIFPAEFDIGSIKNENGIIIAKSFEQYRGEINNYKSNTQEDNEDSEEPKYIIDLSEDGKNYVIDFDYLKKSVNILQAQSLDLIGYNFIESEQEIEESLLAKYVQANIKTLYPSIGSEDVDGKIKIKRDTSSGLKDLKYKPYDELKKMVDNRNFDALNYFSINMENPSNPLLCYITTDVTRYYDASDKLTESKVNSFTMVEASYTNLVGAYAMQYEFLVALHMFTYVNNVEFMNNILDLVDDYEATITLKDTVYTTTTKKTYSGEKQTYIGRKIYFVGEENPAYRGNKGKYDINTNNIGLVTKFINVDTNKIKTVNEIVYTDMVLTHINSWVAETKNEYEKKPPKVETISDNTKTIVSPSSQDMSNNLTKYSAKGFAGTTYWIISDGNPIYNSNMTSSEMQEKEKEGPYSGSIREDDYNKEWRAVRDFEYERYIVKDNTKITTSVTEYKDKNVDTKYNLEKDDGFIDLLKNDKYAADSLISASDWFLTMLHLKTKTHYVEEIMRYVFYKVTNDSNYGVTVLNMEDIIDTYIFSNTSTYIFGGTVEEKVWFTLKSYGFSDYAVAGVMGNIKAESGFRTGAIEAGNNNEGNGLCQWSYSRKTQLKNYAMSKGTSWTDADTQIEFLITEMMGNGPAKGYAGMQWSSESYNSWKNASSATQAAEIFCKKFERPGIPHMDNRKRYAQEYYQKFKGMTYNSGTSGPGGTWKEINSHYLHGSFTNLKGKTFYVFRQGNCGWPNECNRASAYCIASAYASVNESNVTNWMLNTKGSLGNHVLSNANTTRSFFNKYRLTAQIIENPGSYQEKLIQHLMRGGYAAIHVKSPNPGVTPYAGKTNPNWTKNMHWLPVLGYRTNSNGKYEIFITDSSSRDDNGWWPLDEFTTRGLNYLVLISEV